MERHIVIPEDLRYSTEHEWTRVGAGHVIRVGITDYAQEALGDIVFVQMPAVGDSIEAGDSVGEVESTKSVSEIVSPVGGVVTAVNDALESTPELVNSDPYGDGWMYEVEVSDLAVLDDLLDASGYADLVGEG